MALKRFLTAAFPACCCLVTALTPLPPASRSATQSSATEKRRVTELDDNAMKALVGIPSGRARPLLLYLWYTACQPCCAKLVDVERIYAEYKEAGLDVALVVVGPMDSNRSLSIYLEEHNVRAPAYLIRELDDDLVDQIFLKDWEAVVPSAFFYAKSGKIVAADTERGR